MRPARLERATSWFVGSLRHHSRRCREQLLLELTLGLFEITRVFSTQPVDGYGCDSITERCIMQPHHCCVRRIVGWDESYQDTTERAFAQRAGRPPHCLAGPTRQFVSSFLL